MEAALRSLEFEEVEGDGEAVVYFEESYLPSSQLNLACTGWMHCCSSVGWLHCCSGVLLLLV